MLKEVSNYLGSVSNINGEYIYLLFLSLLVIIIFRFINKVLPRIYKKISNSSRSIFQFSQRLNILINIIIVLLIFFIWEKHLNNVVTILSFISAGMTIALKEVILNMFGGLFIKTTKPFKVEDRIEIDDAKGDVVVINAFNFKLLEVGKGVYGEQSSGKIICIPNSTIFSKSLKNYSTAFKYIWTEMVIKIPLDADIEKTKDVLYTIVSLNDTLKRVPKKMNKAVEDASVDYRIYYNYLKPIIYTSVVDNHVELYLRYLVNPKKERIISDEVWTEILKAYKNKKIKLFTE